MHNEQYTHRAGNKDLGRADALDDGIRVVGVKREEVDALLRACVDKMIVALLGHADVVAVPADHNGILRA
jgi:hypothetical protein